LVIGHFSGLLAVVLILNAPVLADDWSITTADFQTQSAQLKSFSPDGVGITPPDAKTDQTIPLDQFVSIQRSSPDEPSTPKFTLLLSNGDRLAGEPGSVVGEKLIWVSPSLGKIPVPFNHLVVIAKGDTATAPDEAPKQDMVKLANGDTAAGVFTNCGDVNVTLQADAGPVTIPLASVNRIAFASTGTAAVESSRAFRIHLADGSMITASDARIDGDQFKITLTGKPPQAISLPIDSVIGIEQTNGPVSWLSSRIPTENIQIPYLPGATRWPARFDTAVDGLPLSFEGKIYDHGIGVHAYSRLTYPIDPQWAAFRTQYAIESDRDDPARYADVIVRIKIDGKVVHEKSHVRAGEISDVIKVDLKGAATLTLECDYGDSGCTQAHLNWLQPALLRATSTVSP
jgi:hypothetical protein